MDSLTSAVTLIGRSRMVQDVVRCLRESDKSGALLIGNPGSGKSAVSGAVIQKLGRHGSVFQVVSSPALSAVPFGALLPFLNGLPSRHVVSYDTVLRALLASRASGAARPIFLVEDAQNLDHSTVGLVARAAATGAAAVLATCRPGVLIPAELLALWDDGILAKFQIPPLSRDEVHQLAVRMLRNEVSPWTSAVFADLTFGNPSMLLSLIEHARATGVLGLRGGTWFLLKSPDLEEVPIAGPISQQISSLKPEEKAVAALVASEGPLSLARILKLVNLRTLDSLERSGIISISAEHIVRPVSPLMGAFVRRFPPPAQLSASRGSLPATASASHDLTHAIFNRARRAVVRGEQCGAEQLVAAACAANANLDASTALRAAAGIVGAGFRSEARIQMAYSHYIMGMSQEAAGFLEQALPAPYGRPSYLAALLAPRLWPPGVPQEVRSRAEKPATRLDEPATGTGEWTRSPASGLASSIAVESWDGRFEDYQRELRAVIEAAEGLREIQVPTKSLLAEVLCAKGQLTAGSSLDSEAWLDAEAIGMKVPLIYEELLARHCLALIRAGDWAVLDAALDDYASEYPERLLFSGGMLHLMRGFSNVRQGRLPEGLSRLLLSVEELRISDPWGYLPLARAVTAYAAASVGQQAEGEKHALAFRSSRFREPKSLRLLAEAYSAAAATGRADGTVDSGPALAHLAEEARRQGLTGVETDIRMLRLRCGDLQDLDALAASSSIVDGPEAHLINGYARAIRNGDAAILAKISRKAMQNGFLLLAVEAAEWAERFLDEGSDMRTITAVRRMVREGRAGAGLSGRLEVLSKLRVPL